MGNFLIHAINHRTVEGERLSDATADNHRYSNALFMSFS